MSLNEGHIIFQCIQVPQMLIMKHSHKSKAVPNAHAFPGLPADPNSWLVLEQKRTLSGPQHFHNKIPQVKPQSSPRTLQL